MAIASHSSQDARSRSAVLDQTVVTAEQMQAIEARIFAAGMPVAALMEKVAGRITQRIQAHCPHSQAPIGVLVGPGHNGGDALVVARELHCRGYAVRVYSPFERRKELTEAHASYAMSIGIPFCSQLEDLKPCQAIVDGMFGFGLTRSLSDDLIALVDTVNRWPQPMISIDLPSGLHTDTGAELGRAIHASHTLCLGLWKRAFVQDAALSFLGTPELIDFDIPLADITAVLENSDMGSVCRITKAAAIAGLPMPRAATTHKYREGHLLLLAGSRQFAGAALLAAKAALASGVGMMSVGVPQSLVSLMVSQVPDALVLGLPETEAGAIAHLPDDLDESRYTVIAAGPGLTQSPMTMIAALLRSDRPLVLDADALNMLAQAEAVNVRQRSAPTLLTPHPGEFRRLFPELDGTDRLTRAHHAATSSGALILLKGAQMVIAHPHNGSVWVNPHSTPALARGGSGDVLTGLLGGLLAQGLQHGKEPHTIAQTAVWWHAQTGLNAAQARTELGVSASTLVDWLIPTLASFVKTAVEP